MYRAPRMLQHSCIYPLAAPDLPPWPVGRVMRVPLPTLLPLCLANASDTLRLGVWEVWREEWRAGRYLLSRAVQTILTISCAPAVSGSGLTLLLSACGDQHSVESLMSSPAFVIMASGLQVGPRSCQHCGMWGRTAWMLGGGLEKRMACLSHETVSSLRARTAYVTQGAHTVVGT